MLLHCNKTSYWTLPFLSDRRFLVTFFLSILCKGKANFGRSFSTYEMCKWSNIQTKGKTETCFVSYLSQPLCVVLHRALQVLQFLSRPFTVNWRRVSLHDARPAARSAVLLGSSALASIQLRQDEGVAALAMLDAVKPPSLICTAAATTTSSSSPLASSSSSSLCAHSTSSTSNDWQGPKQQKHQNPPAEI